MTADLLFRLFNLAALAGWMALAAGILLRRPLLRDTIAGHAVPVLLATAYAALVALFFAGADGGYGSLADVQRLFAAPWVALAGWVHYLAFDLFTGSWIARQAERQGLPRWPLFFILPLCFLFGPVGLLAYHAARGLLRPAATSALAD